MDPAKLEVKPPDALPKLRGDAVGVVNIPAGVTPRGVSMEQVGMCGSDGCVAQTDAIRGGCAVRRREKALLCVRPQQQTHHGKKAVSKSAWDMLLSAVAERYCRYLLSPGHAGPDPSCALFPELWLPGSVSCSSVRSCSAPQLSSIHRSCSPGGAAKAPSLHGSAAHSLGAARWSTKNRGQSPGPPPSVRPKNQPPTACPWLQPPPPPPPRETVGAAGPDQPIDSPTQAGAKAPRSSPALGESDSTLNMPTLFQRQEDGRRKAGQGQDERGQQERRWGDGKRIDRGKSKEGGAGTAEECRQVPCRDAQSECIFGADGVSDNSRIVQCTT